MATSVSNQWWAKIDGHERGPLSSEQLKRLADRGELTLGSEVRRGESAWKPASEVKGLFPAVPEFPIDDALAVDGLVSCKATQNLVGCPDCSELCSPRAAVCPHCGCPLLAHKATPMPAMRLTTDWRSAVLGICGSFIVFVGWWYGNVLAMILGTLVLMRAEIPTRIVPEKT